MLGTRWGYDMATEYFPFQKPTTAPFSFLATFDSVSYNVIVTWNYYGQRYYVNVYTVQGALVACVPMIGSPDDYDISLTAGYFTTKLVYRTSEARFEVT